MIELGFWEVEEKNWGGGKSAAVVRLPNARWPSRRGYAAVRQDLRLRDDTLEMVLNRPMCFSARVQQNLRELSRRYGAEISWEMFAELFKRRFEDDDVKMARALEQSFAAPESDTERLAKDYIDRYTAKRAAEWEAEVFAQKRRLADAERSLITKETKRAREDLRIATRKIKTLVERLTDLRRSQPRDSDERIFPMTYAPVLVQENGRMLIKPMRYTCRLAGKPANYDHRFPGTYNARRDNLAGFWNDVYGRQHAVMVISSFFENVPRHLYERRGLKSGELPENVVLQFNPRPAVQMLVACVWDRWTGPAARDLYSFAAITDEPPAEVSATGHQRCVIALREDNLREWLAPADRSRERLAQILGERETPYYEHQIAA